MTAKEYRELAKAIEDAKERLRNVDTRVQPSNDVLHAYEDLRSSAAALVGILNWVIDGE